jgi:DNA-binding FadR family transcriptional regulator
MQATTTSATPEARRSSVRRELQERILSGALPPGTTIVPAEAAREFEVSATPMREALIELVRDGLLDNRANYGFTVRPLSAVEVNELYPLVWTLEALAIRTPLPSADTRWTLNGTTPSFATMGTRPSRRRSPGSSEGFVVTKRRTCVSPAIAPSQSSIIAE